MGCINTKGAFIVYLKFTFIWTPLFFIIIYVFLMVITGWGRKRREKHTECAMWLQQFSPGWDFLWPLWSLNLYEISNFFYLSFYIQKSGDGAFSLWNMPPASESAGVSYREYQGCWLQKGKGWAADRERVGCRKGTEGAFQSDCFSSPKHAN